MTRINPWHSDALETQERIVGRRANWGAVVFLLAPVSPPPHDLHLGRSPRMVWTKSHATYDVPGNAAAIEASLINTSWGWLVIERWWAFLNSHLLPPPPSVFHSAPVIHRREIIQAMGTGASVWRQPESGNVLHEKCRSLLNIQWSRRGADNPLKFRTEALEVKINSLNQASLLCFISIFDAFFMAWFPGILLAYAKHSPDARKTAVQAALYAPYSWITGETSYYWRTNLCQVSFHFSKCLLLVAQGIRLVILFIVRPKAYHLYATANVFPKQWLVLRMFIRSYYDGAPA